MLVPRSKPAKLLEREVTRQIRDFLKLRGWRAIRMQRTVMPGQFQSGEPGIPDYLFLHYIGRRAAAVLWIELKRPGGRIRPQQQEWHDRERGRGAEVWVVENFEHFEGLYRGSFSWLHDGRLPGQIDLFGGQF